MEQNQLIAERLREVAAYLEKAGVDKVQQHLLGEAARLLDQSTAEIFDLKHRLHRIEEERDFYKHALARAAVGQPQIGH